jgi:hypothetical protein
MASKGKPIGKGHKQRPHDGTWTAEKAAQRERGKAQRAARAEKQAAKDAEMWANIDPTDPVWKQLAIERIKEDPGWWIENFVYTYDQYSDSDRIKLFPWYRPYFPILMETIQRDKVVYIVKSRQMTISWFLCALELWKAGFLDHSECYVQCTNEDTVDYFVQTRMQAIYKRLPKWQQQICAATSFSFCKAKMPLTGSFVTGLPSGSDKARGRAPALFVADELAFQVNGGHEAVASILPAIVGDSWFIGNSTPNMANFFYEMCFPQGQKPIETIIPFPDYPLSKIIRFKEHTVIFLHYTADPQKRSKEWLEAEKAKFFSQGKSPEAWEQEYELSFEKTGRPKLYSRYDPAVHEKDVKYNPFRPVIRGWDFGYQRPACVFMQENDHGQIVLLDALMGKNVEIQEFAPYVLAYCKKNFKPGKANGRDVPIEYKDYCDHAGTQQSDKGSTVKILRNEYGITARSRYSKPEERSNLIAHRLEKRKDGKPGMIVNRHATLLVDGFRGGFTSKGDILDKPTGTPFKDGKYEHVNDAMGYAIEYRFGVRKRLPSKDELAERRRRRRKLQKEYNSPSGYSRAV